MGYLTYYSIQQESSSSLLAAAAFVESKGN
jgi:hypothetical protein